MTTPSGDRELARRALIAASSAAVVLVLLLLLWRAASLLVLLFAGLLLSVLFRAFAELVQRHTRLSYRGALAVVLTALTALVVGFGFAAGPALDQQVAELQERVPQALEGVKEEIRKYSWGRRLLSQGPEALSQGDTVVKGARDVFAGSLRVIGGLLVFLFAGVFIAAEPGLYYRGLLHLVPLRHRPRAGAVLAEMDHVLRWWLIGRGISMIVVGLLVWGGLAVLGVPLALLLGVVAGLLDFIPYFGPVLAAAPGILLSLVEGPDTALKVTGVYVAVQAAENYLISPVVERKTVSLPPALTLGFQVVMGLLAGVVGAALASPLLAALLVLVKRTYVEDTLGDRVA